MVCCSSPAEVEPQWGQGLPFCCRSASLPSAAELENTTLVKARREPGAPKS